MPRNCGVLALTSLTQLLNITMLRGADRDGRRVAVGIVNYIESAAGLVISPHQREQLGVQLRASFEIATIEQVVADRGIRLSRQDVLQLCLKMVLCLESPHSEPTMWIMLSRIIDLNVGGRVRRPEYHPITTFVALCRRLRRLRSGALQSRALLSAWSALAHDLGYCLDLLQSKEEPSSLPRTP